MVYSLQSKKIPIWERLIHTYRPDDIMSTTGCNYIVWTMIVYLLIKMYCLETTFPKKYFITRWRIVHVCNGICVHLHVCMCICARVHACMHMYGHACDVSACVIVCV